MEFNLGFKGLIDYCTLLIPPKLASLMMARKDCEMSGQ